MRTWIKNGVRVGVLMAAIAGVGAGLASSRTMTDRFTLASDRDEDRASAERTGTTTEAAETDQAAPAGRRRGPVAGAAGLAVTALGVTLLIRRRRRAAHAKEG